MAGTTCTCGNHIFPEEEGYHRCPKCNRRYVVRHLEGSISTSAQLHTQHTSVRQVAERSLPFLVLLVLDAVLVGLYTSFYLSGWRAFLVGLLLALLLNVLGYYAIGRIRTITIREAGPLDR